MANNGRQGENLFAAMMTQKGYIVCDNTNEPEYWEKDIDFTVFSPTTGAIKTFEVKWDTRIHSTGNLYLEFINIHSKGGRGWFEFCEADFLAYGDATAQHFFMIPMKELRERLDTLPKRKAYCGNESVGYLVSLDSIQDICQVL